MLLHRGGGDLHQTHCPDIEQCPIRLLCRLDSSSARSLLQKKGVSKVRHLDTKLLWLQRLANDKRAEFAAVSTHVNTSDIGTKLLSTDRYHFLMCRLGYKGFVSSMKEQVKYEQIQAKVLQPLQSFMNVSLGCMQYVIHTMQYVIHTMQYVNNMFMAIHLSMIEW